MSCEHAAPSTGPHFSNPPGDDRAGTLIRVIRPTDSNRRIDPVARERGDRTGWGLVRQLLGRFGVNGDGAVFRVSPENMKPELYAGGFDDPTGLLFVGDTLWVADRRGVYQVNRGRVRIIYEAASFPRRLNFLNDLATGPGGTLYVSDTGDSSSAGAVFVLKSGKSPSVLAGSDTAAAQSSVNGLYRGRADTLYTVGFRSGVLSVTDGHGAWRELARNLGAPDGIATAGEAGFYVTDNDGGNLLLVPRTAGAAVVTLAQGLKAPADLVVDRKRGWLVIPENQGNRLSVYRLRG